VAAAPVAPAAVSLGYLVVGLLAFVVFMVCLALRAVWLHTFGRILEVVADALDFRVLHRSFHFGHPVRVVNRTVLNALERVAERSQAGVGYFFHGAAVIAAWTARELASLGTDVLAWGHWLQRVHLPRWVKALIYATFPPALIARLSAAIADAHVPHLTRVVVHRVSNTISRTIVRVVKVTANAATIPLAGVLIFPRIRALEHWRGYTRRQLRRLAWVGSFAGPAALVAVGLERMGLSWLRCRSLSKLARRVGCGGFGVLDMLIGGTMEAFVLSDLCRFTSLLTRATEQVRPALLRLVDVEQTLLACPGNSAPDRLHMPPLDIPPLVNESVLAV
jgi:hypothetical protein